MEARKFEEVEFHNRLRDAATKADPEAYRALTANKKYYAIAHASMDYYKQWLAQHCRDKVVLDFGCGDGEYSLFLAQSGVRKVIGVDLSDVSVENTRRRLAEAGLADRGEFHVMDCEALEFPDATFDVVCEAGVLHHLNLEKAVSEMARVVKPDGRVICYEAVGHNPVFQMYRRLTPSLRTKYETEHILRMDDVRRMRRLFARVDVRFFHLLVLLGVPFRNFPGSRFLQSALDAADRAVLTIPGIRSQAWMMIFEMSGKKGPVSRSSAA